MTSLSLKLKARELAAGSYNAMVRGVGLSKDLMDFLREYPTQRRYVDAKWEDYIDTAKQELRH